MKLSIIIPCYNEEKTVIPLIKKVISVKFPIDYEIIIINDGSTDSTSKKLNRFRNIKKIKIIEYQENKGKGFAVRKGLHFSKGDIIVIQDADLEYNPNQLPYLIKPILNKETEIVYGSRFLRKENQNWKIPSHYIGNRFLVTVTNLLYRCRLTDMETCYKLFTKEVKNKLNLSSDGFEFEVEFTAQTRKLGYNIIELSITYNPRSYGEGKKINWKDGVKALWYLIKMRV